MLYSPNLRYITFRGTRYKHGVIGGREFWTNNVGIHFVASNSLVITLPEDTAYLDGSGIISDADTLTVAVIYNGVNIVAAAYSFDGNDIVPQPFFPGTAKQLCRLSLTEVIDGDATVQFYRGNVIVKEYAEFCSKGHRSRKYLRVPESEEPLTLYVDDEPVPAEWLYQGRVWLPLPVTSFGWAAAVGSYVRFSADAHSALSIARWRGSGGYSDPFLVTE